MGEDRIEIEVLQDGTIKLLTGTISGANHFSADAFLAHLRDYCGGEQVRTKRGLVHERVHNHVKQGV